MCEDVGMFKGFWLALGEGCRGFWGHCARPSLGCRTLSYQNARNVALYHPRYAESVRFEVWQGISDWAARAGIVPAGLSYTLRTV
jgi:hypothetical protein